MTKPGEIDRTRLQALFEVLSGTEHVRWADWQRYVHEKLEDQAVPGFLVLPKDLVGHWERQIDTPYSELSEREKNADREQVLRYWTILTESVRDWLGQFANGDLGMVSLSPGTVRRLMEQWTHDMTAVEHAAREAIRGTESDEMDAKATVDEVYRVCAEKGWNWSIAWSAEFDSVTVSLDREGPNCTTGWQNENPTLEGACREALRFLASVT